MSRQFHLPQPVQPEKAEQTGGVDVLTVLRQLASLAVAEHHNNRRARQVTQEIMMKISELSSKVDTLISVATTIKSTADSAATHAADIPPDDPEVEALGKRIDDAIAVLQGQPRSGLEQGGATITSPATPPFDPNAPAI